MYNIECAVTNASVVMSETSGCTFFYK